MPTPPIASDNLPVDVPVLQVEELRAHIVTSRTVVRAVEGVSFSLCRGRTIGIVGESGSGKSMACLAILGLLPRGGAVVSGRVLYKGIDLLQLSPAAFRRYRGREIALIPQDPLSALNPVLTVETHVAAALRAHGLARGRRRERVLELLALVGLPSPHDLLARYPHQLSGGMRQRIVIATALAAEPSVLLADEPTSSLDPTIQAQLLQLLQGLRRRMSLATVFVTHDLGIAADVSDDLAVMYAGRIVERGPSRTVLASPRHPYTQGLLTALPDPAPGRPTPPRPIAGRPPAPGEPIIGCSFAPRCPHALLRCRTATPPDIRLDDGRESACWLHTAA
jgi:oligopeptide/dipeptide ABC transporter ATP-binding protein